MANPAIKPMLWTDLSGVVREALAGKLSGLWGAASDEDFFNACAVDKQQTLLIMVSHLKAKSLWQAINRIENVYGEGGVGLAFSADPLLESTLRQRKDFTRLLAKHKGSGGGFYEKGRAEAILHFLYEEGSPRKWYVHFDLFSPVYSLISAIKHLRYEKLGKLTPDWRMIQRRLDA